MQVVSEKKAKKNEKSLAAFLIPVLLEMQSSRSENSLKWKLKLLKFIIFEPKPEIKLALEFNQLPDSIKFNT